MAVETALSFQCRVTGLTCGGGYAEGLQLCKGLRAHGTLQLTEAFKALANKIF